MKINQYKGNPKIFIGSFCVFIAAVSFGLPGSLVKLGICDGANVYEMIFFVFLTSMLVLNIMQLATGTRRRLPLAKGGRSKIILSGTTITLTNLCYFKAIAMTSVAIVAVMLMQSVWIAILLNCLDKKIKPQKEQIIAIILILIGTILATDILNTDHEFSLLGLLLGFMSGFFYALTIHCTANIYPEIPALQRASLMSIGSFLLALFTCIYSLLNQDIMLNLYWGAVISLFAMIIPLLCLGFGLAFISFGHGAIITALELPAAIIFASFLLSEQTNYSQWSGVLIIIFAVASIQCRKNDN